MEQFLGDYGRPRRPFPIFSLSRHDVLLTMFLSLLCLYIAVAVRVGQPATVSGLSPWKGIFVVFGVIWGVIFALLSGLKVFCGYGEYQQPGYNQLSSEDGPTNASDLETNGFQVGDGKFTKNSSNHESNLGSGAQRNGTMSTIKADVGTAGFRGSKRQKGSRLAADEIGCGLVLERAEAEFGMHGAVFPRGTLRVAALQADGVAARQGACAVGDLVCSVNGVRVAGLEEAEVERMMRGRAGTSVMLGIFSDASREMLTRHVVLAPSPASITNTIQTTTTTIASATTALSYGNST
eukprot:CAMPEP_0172180512 /NCGR_PEP_ID=MMETSP1050-20130122/17271_1 /TAXON_ID=233186 /ORGANISM="Cryptomonas curvata, Strain CCAP979/52" /LENGTH=293 /DNA_ID=CAMNT_0012853627 /DNA_START=42 /DNA_END=923 /DNA_ORIENTATION=+